MSDERIPGHHLKVSGVPGSLATMQWSCQCGGWSRDGTPAKGCWGSTTALARISQVRMAHGKHARAAEAAEKRAKAVAA